MSDELAQVYDALGLGRNGEALASLMLTAASELALMPRRAADLAAATGAATLRLTGAGLEVIAFESDPALLAQARGTMRRLGQPVRIVRSPIWQPSLALAAAAGWAGRCDLALASGLIGRLATVPQLEATLTTAAALLRPGGLLVFDLGDAEVLGEWEQYDRLLRDDTDYLAVLRTHFDEPSGTVRRRVIWFVRELETWWRAEASWQEYAWDATQIAAALEQAGLTQVRRLTPREPPEQIVYLAERR